MDCSNLKWNKSVENRISHLRHWRLVNRICPEHLPSKCDALSLNPSAIKTKKREKFCFLLKDESASY
jgi:hypothetical protein